MKISTILLITLIHSVFIFGDVLLITKQDRSKVEIVNNSQAIYNSKNYSMTNSQNVKSVNDSNANIEDNIELKNNIKRGKELKSSETKTSNEAINKSTQGAEVIKEKKSIKGKSLKNVTNKMLIENNTESDIKKKEKKVAANESDTASNNLLNSTVLETVPLVSNENETSNINGVFPNIANETIIFDSRNESEQVVIDSKSDPKPNKNNNEILDQPDTGNMSTNNSKLTIENSNTSNFTNIKDIKEKSPETIPISKPEKNQQNIIVKENEPNNIISNIEVRNPEEDPYYIDPILDD